MKICLVCPHSLSFPGGVQEHVKALYLQFKKRGHQVKIIAPATYWGEKSSSKDIILVGRNRRISFDGTKVPITFGLNYSLRLRKIFRKENFDIFHLHNPWIPTLCWFVLYHAQVPMLATFHTARERIPKKQSLILEPLLKPIVLPLLNKLQGQIAVSGVAKAYSQKYLRKDFAIIPNGVDTKRFSPKVAPIAKFKDGRINLLYVGRLEERKGLLYLLEAYRRLTLQQAQDDLRLIVVGDGPLKKEAKKFVKTSKMKEVYFMGKVSSGALPSYYATADIFCSPATHGESFGIVLLEAMATGLPIVASRIAGYAEVLKTKEEGILVPPKNPKRLVVALSLLVENLSLRAKLGKGGLKKAALYDWDVVAGRILRYYRQVLKRKKEGYNKKRKGVRPN